MAGTDHLSVVFSTLTDPTRRAILDEQAGHDATVTELTAPLSISMPALSRHLN
jgi:DNA-binding transcriptional ArsR family regulator